MRKSRVTCDSKEASDAEIAENAESAGSKKMLPESGGFDVRNTVPYQGSRLYGLPAKLKFLAHISENYVC